MASLGTGITNRQASYLAALCRELGWAYAGSGMTRQQASDAINAAKRELDRRRSSKTAPPPSAVSVPSRAGHR